MNTRGVVTVLQARVGSTRLPGKVLLELGEATVLEYQIARIRMARLYGQLVVATTTDPADEAIVAVCEAARVDYVRGHPTDLLQRHYRVAQAFGASHVVKIPSDCPLIDPAVIDLVIGSYLDAAPRRDYVGNLHPESFPDGNDVEIMSVDALEIAWREALAPHEREHTTPFLWDQPGRFRLGNVSREGVDLSRAYRYVLDYAEDHDVIRAIHAALHLRNPRFGVDDIVEFLEAHPDIARRNARYRGVSWYRHHPGVLRTVPPSAYLDPSLEVQWTR
ncbi:MAG: glycosyltransferase family protein [Gemmatimonadales bacterium]|nr:glycosyltransferase family protein [Gemmatimonadales bacterium]